MPRVSNTSGQGVSRGGYQSSYQLGQHGTGAPGKGALRGPTTSTSRQYTKSSVKGADTPFKMNVDYDAGDALGISNIKDVKGYLKGKPAKGLDLSVKPGKKLK